MGGDVPAIRFAWKEVTMTYVILFQADSVQADPYEGCALSTKPFQLH
jgi:hypothetical protein